MFQVSTRKYQWNSADFQAVSIYLANIDCMSIIHNNPSATCAWAEFVRLLWHAINLFVASFFTSNSCKQAHKPRRSRDLRKCEKKSASFGNDSLNHPMTLSRIANIDCTDEWRHPVRQSETGIIEERVISSNNLGAFCRYVYKRTTNSTGIGVIVDKNGLSVTDNRDKANAFNQFFCSVGLVYNNCIPPCQDVVLQSTRDSVVITSDGFEPERQESRSG